MKCKAGMLKDSVGSICGALSLSTFLKDKGWGEVFSFSTLLH